MWAQIIKMRVKAGKEEELLDVLRQVRAYDRPESGPLRTTAMREQKDPQVLYTMVVFESEEQARAREQDPRRREMLTDVRAQLAELTEGPPEFVDLDVLDEGAPAGESVG